jgi:hypothetical protein
MHAGIHTYMHACIHTLHYVTLQYNTRQDKTRQYNTIQYNTIPCIHTYIPYHTMQYNTIPYHTIQYNTLHTYIHRAKRRTFPEGWDEG